MPPIISPIIIAAQIAMTFLSFRSYVSPRKIAYAFNSFALACLLETAPG
jgi:hypothetical protein